MQSVKINWFSSEKYFFHWWISKKGNHWFNQWKFDCFRLREHRTDKALYIWTAHASITIRYYYTRSRKSKWPVVFAKCQVRWAIITAISTFSDLIRVYSEKLENAPKSHKIEYVPMHTIRVIILNYIEILVRLIDLQRIKSESNIPIVLSQTF